MKRYALLASIAAVGGAVAFQGSVNLQATTPGTPQTGHLNITGTAKAGSMVGYSTTPTGQTFGGDFRAASNEGRALLGNASSATGATYGGLFQNFSNAGRGVAGIAQNSAGTTYGGFFSSLSNQGRGVYGQATNVAGTTYGVYGKAISPTGYGVYSEGNMAATGYFTGARGEFVSGANENQVLNVTHTGPTSNAAVRATSANGVGGIFQGSIEGVRAFGFYGLTGSATGSGAHGVAGSNNATNAKGVYGIAHDATSYGIYGESNNGYGVYSWGKMHATGNFTTLGNITADGTINGNGSGLTNLTGTAIQGRIDITQNHANSPVIKATSNGVQGSQPAAHFISDNNFGGGMLIQTGLFGYGAKIQAATSEHNALETSLTSGSPNGDTAAIYAFTNSSNTSNRSYAGRFEHNGTGGYAVSGRVNNGGSFSIGLFGSTLGGTGVYGEATAASGTTYGIRGYSASPGGNAGNFSGPNSDTVYVLNTGAGRGMQVVSNSDTAIWATTSTGLAGIDGRNGTSNNYAVFGRNYAGSGNSYGVVGSSDGGGFGLFAFGQVGATGAKPFRIDHPLDPENKYLLHYSSESPTPQNFYSGNVKTGRDGKAWVELPEYFSEINTDFKYQLTIVDDSESSNFVMAKIGRKITENRFLIMTNQPNVEVSWRVEATRNDRWMRRNGAKTEVEKTGDERGLYQHPEFYGQGPERGINYKMDYAKRTKKQPQAK